MTVPVADLRALLVAPVDDGALSHNALVRRALERLGVTVHHVDPERSGWIERLVRRDLEHRLRAALDELKPQLVLVSGSKVVPADVVDRLRPGRQARWALLLGNDLSDPHLASVEAMAYGDVFVGASGLVASFDKHGVKHCHYLAVGCDPSVHKPLRARGPFRANVVFVGAATPRREHLLSELVEFGLALWGPGWRKSSLKDYCRGELPSTEDFVRAYAGATVAVNVHRNGPEDHHGDVTGVNRRTFELAAIGVPQVVDARVDLPRHFEDGTEVLVYSTPAELKGQVKRAMQEESYRDRLAERGRQRALREHTYMHRMRELLAAVTA
jgi:spore maturation protein CgeB